MLYGLILLRKYINTLKFQDSLVVKRFFSLRVSMSIQGENLKAYYRYYKEVM